MIALALPLSLALSGALAQEPAPDESVLVPAPAAEPELAEPAPARMAEPVAEPAPVRNVDNAPPERPRRFAFAFLPGLTMGVSPLPSHDIALFFGGRLPRGPWALGYQLTFSTGLAERYIAGLMTHRHHITAMRSFGARERGFVSVGGGAAFLLTAPVVELESRVGLRFGARRRGVVGALVRLGWNIHYREQAPLPQLGLMLGVALI